MTDPKTRRLVSLLESELIPAAGCTEPIAIAYCAARLRELLGGAPESLNVGVSGNILKNVKSVLVPSTGGLKGVRAAVAAGVVAGDPSRGLEVLAAIPERMAGAIQRYSEDTPIGLSRLETTHALDIEIEGRLGSVAARVRIQDKHDNVVYMEKDGEALDCGGTDASDGREGERLTLRDILEFASEVPDESIAAIFERQIACNTAIAEEGLRNDWGAGIGRLLLASGDRDIAAEAKAYAAAGSDARMSGCGLPVIILSGSGNQGLAASLPVARYAAWAGASRESLHRALAVAALVTLYQKSLIGRLSAYCGAVSAGVGAGAGIAYLMDGGYDAVAQTIENAIAILSGTFCDGAKPSCAAKIAAAVDAGILGFNMSRGEKRFRAGEGIVADDVDGTIENVGAIAKEGMRETDRVIIDIMLRAQNRTTKP